MVGRTRQGQVLDVGSQRVADRRHHGVGALAGILDHHVAGTVDQVGVAARPADHTVIAGATDQEVVACVAGEHVVEFVAPGIDVGPTLQGQVLDVGRKRVAHRRPHRVGALASFLDHDVARVLDHVGVAAGTTDHPVVTAAAGQEVVAAVAGKNVVGPVAPGIDVRSTLQGQVLDVGAQPVAHRRQDGIDAGAGVLDHQVAGAVDPVAVGAGATAHRVVAGASVDRVVAGAAGQEVVARVAGEHVVELVAPGIDVGPTLHGQILDVGRKRVAHRRPHRVGALAHVLDHNIAGTVDHVGIAAGTADHPVVAAATNQEVVTAVAGEHVVHPVAPGIDVRSTLQGQVLEVGAQRVAHRRQNGIGAGTGVLDHQVARTVHPVGVVSGAAAHRVIAGASVDRVVAGAAGQDVVGRIADDRVVAGPAHRVLDRAVVGDRHVVRHAVDGRIASRREVDHLRAAVARRVERVAAAGIPDRVDRLRVLREVVDCPFRVAEREVAVEAIDRVAGPRRHVGAVDRLDRRDVVDHRRRGVQPVIERAVLLPAHAGLVATEVRHDRVLAIVLGILGVERVGRRSAASVVGARVAETEAVADLVQVRLEAIAPQVHIAVLVVRTPIVVEPDLASRDAPVVRAVVAPSRGSHEGVCVGSAVGRGSVFELDLPGCG